MSILRLCLAVVACVTLASVTALLQGCAAGAPQYVEASPALAPAETAAAQSAGGQGAGARAVATAGEEPAAGAGGKAAYGVTGVWQGQSWANCNLLMMADETRCGAVNPITFTLLQKQAEVGGYYKCAFGNMNCLNMNETGRVATGNLGPNMLSMRVMMPDGSDCMFNGHPAGDAMEGSYLCMQGGGLIEQGLWRVRRSY